MEKVRALLADYDLGDAARAASIKGDEFSEVEFEAFRRDQRSSILPRKTLAFDGEHYSFA
jgi:hypothetical protein